MGEDDGVVGECSGGRPTSGGHMCSHQRGRRRHRSYSGKYGGDGWRSDLSLRSGWWIWMEGILGFWVYDQGEKEILGSGRLKNEERKFCFILFYFLIYLIRI